MVWQNAEDNEAGNESRKDMATITKLGRSSKISFLKRDKTEKISNKMSTVSKQ